MLRFFIIAANLRHGTDCISRKNTDTVTIARSTSFARETAVAKSITIKFDKYRGRTTVADSMCSSGCFCFVKIPLSKCRGPPLSEKLYQISDDGGIKVFDKKSLYVLNKKNPDAIVCSDATGKRVHITRADFATEEEFLFWKNLSDSNYQETDRKGRSYYDNTVVLNEDTDTAGESLEDGLIAAFDNAMRNKESAEKIRQIRSILTEKQFRRLWKHYAERIPVAQIAALENTGEHAIYVSISNAKNKISKKFPIDKKTWSKNT